MTEWVLILTIFGKTTVVDYRFKNHFACHVAARIELRTGIRKFMPSEHRCVRAAFANRWW